MARLDKIRNQGAIPERRHDAFLLALLLAVSLNVAFFAVQALIPRLAYLLQLLGPEAAMQKEEEEVFLPFVLVDPDLEPEDVTPDDAAAESFLSREARQTEPTPDLPEDQPFVDEGVEEILSPPEGSMGPELGTHDAPKAEATQAEPAEEVEADRQDETVGEDSPAEEYDEQPELEPPPEPEPVPEPIPEPEPPVEPPPPEPEPISEPEPEPEPPAEPPPPEPLPPEPEPQPDPVSELVDLAALPVSPEGLFDPQTQYLEELARPAVPPPAAPVPVPVPEAFQPAVPETPQERPRERTGRRQPTFRRIGGASQAASTPSVSGGAPSRVNRRTGVNLLDSDPNMKLLEHRYGQYMRQVARLLQESLNREVMLNPTYYTRGQAKIMFSIAADGSLAYYDTQYPATGELDYVRITSERTVTNAGPFEPPTRQMLEDPLFRRMSVTVNLY